MSSLIRARGFNPHVFGPALIDSGNPLTIGLSFGHHLGQSNIPAFSLGGVVATPNFNASAGIRGSKAGLGMGGPSGAWWGGNSASNTRTMNTTQGTILFYVLSDFTPTDSVAHYLFSTVGSAIFDCTKYSDNNWYFGWTGGAGRVVVAASGTFSQGKPYTVGGTWSSAGTKFYVAGKLVSTNSNAPSTSSTSGSRFEIGSQAGGIEPFITNTGTRIYLCAIWNRILTPGEVASFEADPWQVFAGARPRRSVKASAGGDVTVALTGASATASAGTLIPNNAVAVAGAAGTASAGTLAPSLSVALSGEAATGAAGSVVYSPYAALSGVEATVSLGDLFPGSTVPLTGIDVAALAGTITVLGAEPEAPAAAGGLRRKRRGRKIYDDEFGNTDFTGKRNSRPGVAEEEIGETLAALKLPKRAPAAYAEWDEDDDEEAILWLL